MLRLKFIVDFILTISCLIDDILDWKVPHYPRYVYSEKMKNGYGYELL